MVTKVQRRALWWMLDNGGEIMIVTGHKTVRLGKIRQTETPLIAGNVNFLDGLMCNGLIEPVGPREDYGYRLTDAGKKAAGTRPDAAR